LGGLLLVLALAWLVAPRPAAGASVPICGSRTNATLQQSSEARVYVRDGTVLACAPKGGRAYRLGNERSCYNDCRGIEKVRVSGRFVAYADVFSDKNSGDDSFVIRVRDARSGRVIFSAGEGSAGTLRAVLDRLVLDRRGKIGWISSSLAEEGGTLTGRFVSRSPDCGPRQLASDARIDAGYLRLEAGGTLSWRVDGQIRRAQLCPLATLPRRRGPAASAEVDRLTDLTLLGKPERVRQGV